ncbi:apoptosis regulatory protein Siva-like [Elysia marginata]|uniref:Apoptosis regulatory protein Siva-like n=1 Tax=Elysia marginata TaxID=1093978 RepID=A0AAV4EHA7_9GAST|nr:apoptosis regulatory protein Siva-like [Elysia marginata]
MDCDMSVDINDNHTSYARLESGFQVCENSSLKQLHLNSNCELVQSEEAMSFEMQTDLDTQMNKKEVPSSFVFGTPAVEHCTIPTMPAFGYNFGRNSGALSPAKSGTSCFENHSLEKVQSLEQSCPNAFSLLMQSNVKNAGCGLKSSYRACYNCRQPVALRDVVKCQFCEQYICSGCMRQCQGCFLHYCQLCSVVNYDQIMERAFCLACSGR